MSDAALVGEMEVMDPTGHTSVKWNVSNEDEIETARMVFKRMRKKGYRAFYAGMGGTKKGPMEEFDPEAKRMVLIPQLIGG